MDRRRFLQASAGAAGLAACGFAGRSFGGELLAPLRDSFGPRPPAYSVVPVVGDGRWIWTEPPQGPTGYLDPRSYELSFGIELEGTGDATQIKSSTVAPVELPEQQLEDVRVEPRDCDAALRPLTAEAGQLVLAAGSIAKGQTISATLRCRVTLSKDYRGYAAEQFPAQQKVSRDLRIYLGDSPGIGVHRPEVKELARDVGSAAHPWDQAHAYYQWVWEHIQARPGTFAGVQAALRDRVGDCEERAAVFVALCRSAGIPARLIWVPNHNWAEFCLLDEEAKPHWIPAHTSCYSWFGWTGAHELILQKGDRISVPEKRQPQRLVADWLQWRGAKPEVRFSAELTPLPPEEGADAGPGQRRKDGKGEWVVVGQHPLDPYLRDGDRAGSQPVAGG